MLQMQQVVYQYKITKKGDGACIYIPCSFAEKDISIAILDPQTHKPIQTIITRVKRLHGTGCFLYVPRKLIGQDVKVVISLL